MKRDISQEVLENIKKQRVRPKPRWHFVLRRSFITGLFVLSILIGGLASSVVIFQLTHADWDLYQHLRHSFWEFTFLVIPYFWIGFMLCFALFANFFFRRTGRGYRYRAVSLVVLSVAISLGLGAMLDWGGFSERFERVFQTHVPFYQRIQARRMRICVCPENGLLAGTIVATRGKGEVTLKDFKGNRWLVDVRQATWRGRLTPRVGLSIRIIGKEIGRSRFLAREIRPWRGCVAGICGLGRGNGRGMGMRGRCPKCAPRSGGATP